MFIRMAHNVVGVFTFFAIALGLVGVLVLLNYGWALGWPWLKGACTAAAPVLALRAFEKHRRRRWKE
ncbi:MAG: hypothetical protein RL684_852 [Pseudomonadota bacterium]|jgi:hypothetical protein